MSAPGLTSGAQLQYILQWFREFSELQREDFLPILAAARGDDPDGLAATLATLNCQDKPVSLFQCRIKLFNEWYPTWSEEEQDRLVKGITEVDQEFGKKFEAALINGIQINGVLNGFADDHFKDNVEENSVRHAVTNGELEEATEQVAVQESIPLEIAATS